MREAREKIEADNPVIEEFLLTRYMHYEYMGLVEHADGSAGTPNLPLKPKLEDQQSSIAAQVGFSWQAQQVKRMPVSIR